VGGATDIKHDNKHLVIVMMAKYLSKNRTTYHLANTSTGISYPYVKRNSVASFVACWTNALASAGKRCSNMIKQKLNF